MDVTPSRGYPYPECDPPRVKDAADGPTQLRALAYAIDADLSVLNGLINQAANAQSVDMQQTVAQAVPVNGRVGLDTTVHSTGILPDLTNNLFTITETALYMISGCVTSTAGPANIHRLSLRRNGVIIAVSSTGPQPLGGANPLANGFAHMALLTEGDMLYMTSAYIGGPVPTFQFARLSAVRISALS